MMRAGGWMAVVGMMMWCGVANATVVYLGLPDGRSVAYTTSDAGWSRAEWADAPDVGSNAFPALADLDGDGDADLLVGHGGGVVVAFENIGSATTPVWARRADWDPAGDVGTRSAPALGDLDGDGDPDLVVGSSGGTIVAYENTGGSGGPLWERHPAWDVAAVGEETRPALGDVDHDGHVDLVVGTEAGPLAVFLGIGGGALARATAWDLAPGTTRTAPALADLDGDGLRDLVVEDGQASARAFRNGGSGWQAGPAAWVPPDPGSGPAGVTIVAGTLVPGTTPPGDSHVVAVLDASTAEGGAPLDVRFDASASRAANGAPLSFTWDFGDGTTIAGGGGTATGNASDTLRAAGPAYAAAKRTRDAGHYDEAISQYLAVAATLVPLTSDTSQGTVSKRGTTQVNRVARWYLQKMAHDLGGIYLWHDVGLDTCGHLALSLLWSLESKAQAEAGGFPELPAMNGTNGNIGRATTKLGRAGCAIPSPMPMFASAAAAEVVPGGAVAEHVYTRPGTFTARVTATDGTESAVASVVISVDGDGLPDAPGGPGDNDADASEGFGATTPGGEGGTVIHVTEASEAAVREAFTKANGGHAIVRFAVDKPIAVHAPLPRLTGAFVTIDGNGATLYGENFPRTPGMVDVRGHDVIVKNIRLRNAGDNLRAQGDGAYNIVFRHVSSTGSGDDGISVGYGAHDVTIQHCFLAGNTRSIFMKYGATTNVSIHHTWVQKQWIRGPLVSQAIFADVRNVIVEDWTLWGTRFEKDSSGNVVNSLFALSPYAKSVGGKTNSALRLIQSGSVYTAGNSYGGIADDGADGDAAAPLPAPPVTTLPTAEMADVVRTRAGCLPRDQVDQGYIESSGGWDVSESEPYRLGPGS